MIISQCFKYYSPFYTFQFDVPHESVDDMDVDPNENDDDMYFIARSSTDFTLLKVVQKDNSLYLDGLTCTKMYCTWYV